MCHPESPSALSELFVDAQVETRRPVDVAVWRSWKR